MAATAAASITAIAAGIALIGSAAGAPHERDGTSRPVAVPTDHHPFTLLATGDVIPYPSIMAQAKADAGGADYDFRPIFEGVRPVVQSADIALCHLETTFAPAAGPFTGYPDFASPPQLAAALRDTGYDGCSTASNHALDQGTAGIDRTLIALDDAGVKHAGTGRSKDEAAQPALLRAGGARVAQLSYTLHTNDKTAPPSRPWSVNLLDTDRIVADARAARKAGADLVVVSVHWGTEWQQAPDRTQLVVADRLTKARTEKGGRKAIDLVIGTHNHTPQPYEKVNGTWVVYGLGDQVASFGPEKALGNDSSAARFTFTPRGRGWRVTKAEYLPQHADAGPPFRVGFATPDTYPEPRDRIRAGVLSRGAERDGLHEGDPGNPVGDET
ncbi:CapA family protein [Streptomyces sp. A7024]|uniref:CapA family protein n=2 Tax=Streptomyces coryli TaxID=1128680 RepID=A0A6G4UB99_9ACTN|nr:CapA family protein [Streptomyces coryli]